MMDFIQKLMKFEFHTKSDEFHTQNDGKLCAGEGGGGGGFIAPVFFILHDEFHTKCDMISY